MLETDANAVTTAGGFISVNSFDLCSVFQVEGGGKTSSLKFAGAGVIEVGAGVVTGFDTGVETGVATGFATEVDFTGAG